MIILFHLSKSYFEKEKNKLKMVWQTILVINSLNYTTLKIKTFTTYIHKIKISHSIIYNKNLITKQHNKNTKITPTKIGQFVTLWNSCPSITC